MSEDIKMIEVKNIQDGISKLKLSLHIRVIYALVIRAKSSGIVQS